LLKAESNNGFFLADSARYAQGKMLNKDGDLWLDDSGINCRLLLV